MWQQSLRAGRRWPVNRRAKSSIAPPVTALPDTDNPREMPSPRGLPIVGTTLSLLAAGGAPKLHQYVDRRHHELGPVYRESIGPTNAVFVSDPAEMRRVFSLEGRHPKHLLPEAWMLYNSLYGCKRGLFFMDDEEWLELRRLMNKLLLKADNVDTIVPACETVVTDLVKRWHTSSGKELQDLGGELYKWSIDIIISVLLGPHYEAHKQELEPALQSLASSVHCVFQESARLSLIPAKLAAFLHLAAWTRFVSVVDSALNAANDLVVRMIPFCQHGEGLLSRMLAEGLQEEVVVRIVADLILAAGDTTAYSTQWALYLLARNPTVQEQLYQEVQSTSNSGELTQLPLLRGVMREALRLYPVATFLTRYLPEDCQIGGYNVEAGNLILLSLYTSGRDAKYFPEPTRFWPQRWVRNEKGSYTGVGSPYASLPFAMGARSCVGRKIAETQIILTLAELTRKFKLDLMNPEPVEMILRLVAVPEKPIRLHLTER